LGERRSASSDPPDPPPVPRLGSSALWAVEAASKAPPSAPTAARMPGAGSLGPGRPPMLEALTPGFPPCRHRVPRQYAPAASAAHAGRGHRARRRAGRRAGAVLLLFRGPRRPVSRASTLEHGMGAELFIVPIARTARVCATGDLT
jgi:hypothetical protein